MARPFQNVAPILNIRENDNSCLLLLGACWGDEFEY